MAACLTEPPTPSLGKCSATQCQIIQCKDHSYPSSQDRALTQSAIAQYSSKHVERQCTYDSPCVLASGFHDEVRQPAIQFHGVWVFQQTKRTFGLDSGTLIFLSSRQSVKVLSAHAVLRALLQVVHWFQILDGPGLVTKSSRSRSVVESPTAGRLFLSQKTSSQSRTSWLAGNGFVTARLAQTRSAFLEVHHRSHRATNQLTHPHLGCMDNALVCNQLEHSGFAPRACSNWLPHTRALYSIQPRWGWVN